VLRFDVEDPNRILENTVLDALFANQENLVLDGVPQKPEASE
jgi:hypothetical protein